MTSFPATLSEAAFLGTPASLKAEQTINPGEWNAWIALGGALAAGLMWLWRHSLGAVCLWMWNFIQAPKLIKQQNERLTEMFKEIKEVKAHAEYAVVTSRIAWDYAERPVLQFDSLGACSYVNSFLLRVLARQQDEFLGSNWLSLVHSDDAERVERQWNICVRDRRTFAHEFRIITSSGVEVKVFDRAEVMRDRNDNVLGWYHLMHVIHD